MELVSNARFVVIGAGVHGLSTAYHLALELKARGIGGGEDIVLVDKLGIGGGASGIACGVVRNNYFQPAMTELMAACVDAWEADPEAYCYNSVGFLLAVDEAQEPALAAVHERHRSIGYPSTLVRGGDACDAYMREIFPDWRAKEVSVILHEHRGGFAFNIDSMQGIARKARAEGVRIYEGVRVESFAMDGTGTVTAVRTSHGEIACEQVIIGAGPWAGRFWEMLGLPDTLDVRTIDGELLRDRPMWTYWYLQEGEIRMDPGAFARADGTMPPVVHVDSTAPLRTDDGRLVTDELWGIYFKRDRHGVQGGAAPIVVGSEFDVDPYPTASVEPGFPDMWCAALSSILARFEGCRALYREARSGGAGCFTYDSFPIFDYARPNVYLIADSNHGYKMLGVGKEVARVVLGDHSSLLYPFRFDRFATGDLHPVSSSPYPWS